MIKYVTLIIDKNVRYQENEISLSTFNNNLFSHYKTIKDQTSLKKTKSLIQSKSNGPCNIIDDNLSIRNKINKTKQEGKLFKLMHLKHCCFLYRM
jgi:hypothetical protein